MFWAGKKFSDKTCRQLSLLQAVFKCAHVPFMDSNPWLKYPIIRFASHGCAADYWLEVCSLFIIRTNTSWHPHPDRFEQDI